MKPKHTNGEWKEMLENLTRIIERIEENNLQDNFPSAYKRAKQVINKTK